MVKIRGRVLAVDTHALDGNVAYVRMLFKDNNSSAWWDGFRVLKCGLDLARCAGALLGREVDAEWGDDGELISLSAGMTKRDFAPVVTSNPAFSNAVVGIEALHASMEAAARKRREERQLTQMTLGGLIATLRAMPAGARMQSLHNPHSYRGYYEDLAFETSDSLALWLGVPRMVEILEKQVGRSFTGYKGGEYVMRRDTPLWVAEWGCTGKRLMGLSSDGTLILADDE